MIILCPKMGAGAPLPPDLHGLSCQALQHERTGVTESLSRLRMFLSPICISL